LLLEPLEDRTLLSEGWAISNGGTGTLGTFQEISAPDAAGNLYGHRHQTEATAEASPAPLGQEYFKPSR
jgi:hypothetical protein